MNLETKITIYKFTPQVFTLTLKLHPDRIINRQNRGNGTLYLIFSTTFIVLPLYAILKRPLPL